MSLKTLFADQILHNVAGSPNKVLRKCPEADHNVWDSQGDVIDPITIFIQTHFTPVECAPLSSIFHNLEIS